MWGTVAPEAPTGDWGRPGAPVGIPGATIPSRYSSVQQVTLAVFETDGVNDISPAL